MDRTWRLVDEVGGEEELRALITDFYDRLYADVMIGFFFLPHDKQDLIAHQMQYVRAHIGAPDTKYQGRSMRRAHESSPILPGHFDRRHQLLKDVLQDHDVPDRVQRVWLDLDQRLRPFILQKGQEERERRLSPDRVTSEK